MVAHLSQTIKHPCNFFGRWNYHVDWRTLATRATWMLRFSVSAQCQKWKRPLKGRIQYKNTITKMFSLAYEIDILWYGHLNTGVDYHNNLLLFKSIHY